jgi:hypothetical protein
MRCALSSGVPELVTIFKRLCFNAGVIDLEVDQKGRYGAVCTWEEDRLLESEDLRVCWEMC